MSSVTSTKPTQVFWRSVWQSFIRYVLWRLRRLRQSLKRGTLTLIKIVASLASLVIFTMAVLISLWGLADSTAWTWTAETLGLKSTPLPDPIADVWYGLLYDSLPIAVMLVMFTPAIVLGLVGYIFQLIVDIRLNPNDIAKAMSVDTDPKWHSFREPAE